MTEARSSAVGCSSRVARGLIAAVASVLLVTVGFAWATLPLGLSPAGPSCGFEHNPGSGASGVGTEHIDWGLLPDRVCIDRDGIRHSGLGPSESLLASLALFGLVALAGFIGFGVASGVFRSADPAESANV